MSTTCVTLTSLHSEAHSIPVFNTKPLHSKPSFSISPGKIPAVCTCPHIFLADDDPFQGFYYETLFQKSLDFEGLAIEKKDFGFDLFKSGEELLTRYQSTKICRCTSRRLMIIVDYNMGKGKMNGIETALKLREIGFAGIIILRTSETDEYLKENHKDLERILERKAVNEILGKNNHNETKERIQRIMGKLFERQ